jgi:hypothetical protein
MDNSHARGVYMHHCPDVEPKGQLKPMVYLHSVGAFTPGRDTDVLLLTWEGGLNSTE